VALAVTAAQAVGQDQGAVAAGTFTRREMA